MRSYLNYMQSDLNILSLMKREKMLDMLKKRFVSYGYQQVLTPAFEPYDLYTSVTGTINKDDMIKIIDRTGRVLVLRPDITIPITKKVANERDRLSEELRYFYILDVFRHTFNQVADYERTQAGVEFLGKSGPEADAEVIALAIHILTDLQMDNFTIEIGHAGFFKEILTLLNLSEQETNRFKRLIESKNIPGLQQFSSECDVDCTTKNLIKEIPHLYGTPTEVFRKLKNILFTSNTSKKINELEKLCNLLEAYQCEDRIVLNLGLINHMDYYSDVIFQGYVKEIGKPILSGGRYDRLADQFQASIPAVGFAFDVDLFLAYDQEMETTQPNIISVYYHADQRNKAIQLTQLLRNKDFNILLYPFEQEKKQIGNPVSIHVGENVEIIIKDKTSSTCIEFEEVINQLQALREEQSWNL